MPFHQQGAQRAPTHRVLATLLILVVASALALGGLSAAPPPAGATDATATPAAIQASPTPSPTPTSTSTSSATPTPTLSPTSSPIPPPVDLALAAVASPAPTPSLDAAAAAKTTHPKVVVIVGPVGGQTRRYIRLAREIAAQARSYGARVTELYSPNATWARVQRAAQGANLLVYLGHGNGWPSGHGPFDPARKDGFGLNAEAGRGNGNLRYYGESLIARSIRLAPDAVVILNHLCYASGDSEWGRPNPRRATAIARVDNFGAGFLRAGAAAVIADGLNSPAYVLRGLFRTNRTLRQIFWSAGHAMRSHAISFASRRTPGARAIMDPYAPSRYYRSIIGRLEVRASDWR